MTEQSDYVSEQTFSENLVEVFGLRCDDFHENCIRCQAWLLYDVVMGVQRNDAIFMRSSLLEKIICLASESENDADDSVGEARELLMIRRG